MTPEERNKMRPKVPISEIKVGQLFQSPTGRIWQRLNAKDPRVQSKAAGRKGERVVYGILVDNSHTFYAAAPPSLSIGYVRSWSNMSVEVWPWKTSLAVALDRVEP